MDLQKLIDFRNHSNPFAHQLGILVEDIHDSGARVTKTIAPEDLNTFHRAHGGVYFSMADTACGSAAAARGYTAVTVNASYNYFRGARLGDRLTAEAREVKRGRTICVYDVDLTDQNGQLLGAGTFTFYLTDQPLEL